MCLSSTKKHFLCYSQTTTHWTQYKDMYNFKPTTDEYGFNLYPYQATTVWHNIFYSLLLFSNLSCTVYYNFFSFILFHLFCIQLYMILQAVCNNLCDDYDKSVFSNKKIKFSAETALKWILNKNISFGYF